MYASFALARRSPRRSSSTRFIAGDYSIQYVQKTSDAAMPLFYKITSFWGGLDGSMLFWVLLHTPVRLAGAARQPRPPPRAHPHAAAVLSVITAFFAGLLLFIKDPFGVYLLDIPSAGQEPEPAATEQLH